MYNSQMPSQRDLPSSKQLKRSTFLALCFSAFLMTTVVLPAEYGQDPTGIGDWLGLTSMGKIKQALAQEASEAITETTQGTSSTTSSGTPMPTVAQTTPAATTPQPDPIATEKHEMQITLAPGQGAEVKLEMKKGTQVSFEWTSVGGVVNFDAHGDPYNPPPKFFHGYKKGRQVAGDQGVLTAAFDGKHGWFWRNRENQSVTIKLKTWGDYIAIERVS